MNKDEFIAKSYLESLKLGDFIFEPNGDDTFPDFGLENNRIGVEVRRLNEQFKEDECYEGLEKLEYSLYHAVLSVINGFNVTESQKKYYVSYDYCRPISVSIINIKKELEKELQQFLSCPKRCYDFNIGPSLSFRIEEKKQDSGSVFSFLGHDDGDNLSAPVVDILYKNIVFCIEEKKRKIQKSWMDEASKYPKLWLVLVNHIYPFLKPDDAQMLSGMIILDKVWDRLVILDSQTKKVQISLDNSV